MLRPKLFGIFLGIVFLILGFLVIFGNYYVPQKTNQESSNRPAVEESIPKQAQKAENPPVSHRGLSDLISNKVAEDVARLNTEGLTKIGGDNFVKLSNPEKIVDEIIQEEIAKLEKEGAFDNQPEIELDPSLVLTEYTEEDIKNYLDKLQRIVKENFSSLDLNNFSAVTAAHDSVIRDLRKIKVPSELEDFHKKELALLIQQKSVFEKFKNLETQPLAAVLAAVKAREVNKEFADLYKQLIAKYAN